MKNKFLLYANLLMLGGMLSLGVAFAVWSGPFNNPPDCDAADGSASPPACNAPAPLDESRFGQTKKGGLTLNTNGATDGLIVDNGGDSTKGKVTIKSLANCTLKTQASGEIWCGTDIDTDTDQQTLSADVANGTITISNSNSTVTVTAKNMVLGGFTGGSGTTPYVPVWNTDGKSLASSRIKSDLTTRLVTIEANTLVDGSITTIGQDIISIGGAVRGDRICISGACRSSWPNLSDVLSTGNNAGGQNIAGVEKLTANKIEANIVDPVYSIGGINYATYMAGMVGLKEETTGVIKLAFSCELLADSCKTSTVIDFNTVLEGSDLWLFAKTTNLKNNFDKLVVILTPSFDGKIWYEKDAVNNRLVVYAAPSNSYQLQAISYEISYRLTAPRFDSAEWTNYNTDIAAKGLIIND